MTSTRSHLFLLRYNADGTPDSTFGVNGRVVVDRLASNIADSGQAVAVQNDGRLLVVARQGTLGTIPALSVLRFNTNGTLDTTFGNAGEVATGNLARPARVTAALPVAPATLAVAGLLLAGVTLAACLGPARRGPPP